jgi:hypothetical protein
MAISNKHGKQTIAQGIHGTIAYEYANATARLAASGFQAEDLYKQAIQLDDKSVWILVSISPITWAAVGSNPSLIQGISAGTALAAGPTVVFSNANGVSFGANGSTITASVQPSGLAGFIAGTGTATSGTLSFVNSNGVTFGIDGTQLTASILPGAAAGIGAVQAGTQTQTSGTLAFINSNGLTFGMNNSSQITGSYTVPSNAGLISAINVSAGNTSNNLSALTFNNGNNVSFGLNGSTITASVLNQTSLNFSNSNGLSFGIVGSTLTGSYTVPNVPAQTQYLFSNANGVSFGTAGSTITASVVSQTANIFSNSNGISFGTNGSTITASYTVPTQTSLSFSNANGISFGLNGSTLTGSVAAQTNQTGGRYAVGNTTGQSSSSTFDMRTISISGAGNVSVGYSGNALIVSGAGGNGSVNISAGTTSNNLNAITFSNSNGLSFGLDGSTITGSYSTLVFSNSNGISFGINAGTLTATVQPGAAAGLAAIQAGTQTATSGTVTFGNSNGITFGMSGSSQITASYTVPSTAGLISNINVSAGTTSNNLSAFTFSNSNGLSFGLNGSTLTGSYTVPSTVGLISAINVSAGTTSNNLSAITFSNSNGLSFGLNGSTITGSYTVPTQTNQTEGRYAIGNTTGQSSSSTFDARTMSISGAGNISVGYSGNALVISGSAANGNINISAGTTSNNLTNFVFSNSNNVSFGLNGSTITATITVPAQTNQTVGLYALGNTTQNSSTTLDARSLSFNGLGAATVGYSNGSIQISVPVQSVQTQSNIQAIYDGANSISTGTIRYSNSNGISFGINGQTLTASHNGITTQTNQTVGLYALGNTTQNSSTTLDARSLSFNGLGNITAGYSNGSIQLSGSQSVQTQNIVVPSAGTQTATSGTIVYSNSNNITFGMSNSSRITASYNFNLSAGTTSNNLNAITFSNSNGVTFGLNGSVITASVVPPSGAVVTVSAGTTSNALPAIYFNNANNVSFGLDGSTITASVVPPSGAVINISAGTTSNNVTALTFSNSNGLSFGLNGSTITGSYTVPTQTNQTVGLYALGNTTQNSSSTLDARSLSFNGLGIITVGYSNGSIQLSASQSVQTQSNIQAIYDGANSISTGTIRFSNSNGISFGVNGQTITASHNGITSQTNQTLGLYAAGNTTGQSSSSTFDARSVTFSGAGVASVGYSNGSVVISVPAAGASINISAGTTSNNLNAITFSNSNGLAFGLNGSVITGSYTVPTQTNQTVGLYALGNTTQNSSTTLDARSLSFNGLGAATVGYSNGSVQVSVPIQTVQTQSLIQAVYDGANSITTGTIRFTNANGVSFSINGQTISGSVAAQTVQTQNIVVPSAGTQTATSGTVVYSNSNNITFGMSNSSRITASYNFNVSAGTTSNNLNAITFNNANGISFGLDASTITASYTVPTQTNQTVGLYALGNTTQNSSTTLDARSLSFNGLGAATIGYSNGSVQVSVPVQTVQTQNLIQAIYDGANSITTGTIRFSNLNGISFGINGQTLTASYNGISNINISGGTTSNNLSAITFSNSNNISFGLNGSTLTASASRIQVSQLGIDNPWETHFNISNASFSLQQFNANADILASQAKLLMICNGNTNSSGALTVSLGIYTKNGSTLSLMSSDSRQISWTSGSQTTASSIYGGISGTRYRTVSLNNWSISAGQYMLGMWFRTTNNGTWAAFGKQGPTIVGALDNNETNQYLNGFSTSSYSSGMIASLNVTDTNYVRTGQNALQQPSIMFLGTF